MALQYRRAPGPDDFDADDYDSADADAADGGDDTLPCPACGEEISDLAWRCPRCGHCPEDEVRARRHPWWWIAALVLCLAMILVWSLT